MLKETSSETVGFALSEVELYLNNYYLGDQILINALTIFKLIFLYGENKNIDV